MGRATPQAMDQKSKIERKKSKNSLQQKLKSGNVEMNKIM